MKTIIYLRTSTEEQNPENQRKDCINLTKSLRIKEYEILEEKQSAWKDEYKRAVFNEIRKAITKRKYQNLIVWDLDRLYRNRKKLVGFFEICKIYGCKIYSVRQKFLEDINKAPEPWNEMLFNNMVFIFGYLAEEESKKKSERVKAAIRLKDDGAYSYKGKKWGRARIPKSAVEGVLKLFRTGFSVRKIARKVFYRDKSNRKRNVSKSAVHKILQEKIGKDYLKKGGVHN